MSGRCTLLFLVSAAVGPGSIGCGRPAVAKENVFDGRTVELTVYKDNFAMVRESRQVDLDAGVNRLDIADLSDELDPSSVLFSWATPETAEVASDTYTLGATSGRAMLKRYLGQPVTLVHYGQDGKPGERLPGTLQVATDQSVVIQSDGKYLIDPDGMIVAPARADVVPRSQLTVAVQSRSNQRTKLGVAYLTGGLGWSADYVASVDAASATMTLECWATVTNHTGIPYPDAKLTLMAGSPNRAVKPAAALPGYNYPDRGRGGAGEDVSGFGVVTLSSQAAPAVTGELYAYPIASTATIAPEEMNRVRLLAPVRVPVTKDYAVRLQPAWLGGGPVRQNATLTLNFTDSVESHLGQPLPQGTVRAYDSDGSGSSQYIGSADMLDTPTDQLVSLTLSNVFDLTSMTKLTASQLVDKHHESNSYAVRLSNQKSVSVIMRVVQGFSGTYKLVRESTRSRKLDAHDAQWKLTVPAKGHADLAFTVIVPI